MSSFIPDERSLSGRIEISRNLKLMRKKVLNAKPCVNSIQDANLLPSAWRRNVYRANADTRKTKEDIKSRKARPASARSRTAMSFSSPPETLGLARVLSANRRKAQNVDYSNVVHTKQLTKMYNSIGNIKSSIPVERGDSGRTSARQKGFANRVSINWETGIVSAPSSPSRGKTKEKRTTKTKRPQSAPARRNVRSLRSEQCRAYKEAIKDYIVENSIYEEEKLQQLFENYKKDKQQENEDIIIRAIEELKLELNVA